LTIAAKFIHVIDDKEDDGNVLVVRWRMMRQPTDKVFDGLRRELKYLFLVSYHTIRKK